MLMAEVTRVVMEKLRTDIATCLGAVKFLEERGTTHETFQAHVTTLDRALLQMQGRLDRLETDVGQLDHVVQTPNGNPPLTTLVERNSLAIHDIQTWRRDIQARFWTVAGGLLVALIVASGGLWLKVNSLEQTQKTPIVVPFKELR